MKKYIAIIVLVTVFSTISTYSQVGMMTNTANKNAVLDLNPTTGTNTKGLLWPKVALTATSNFAPLTAHVEGMHVYNTATAGTGATAVTPGEYYNNGTKWVRIPSNAWLIDGNTNGAVKAIGTNDTYDLPVETNGVERMRVTTDGKLLVNTVSSLDGGETAKVQINTAAAGAIQIKDGTQSNGLYLTSDANGVGTWQAQAPFGSLGEVVALNYSLGTRDALTNSASYINGPFRVPKTGWYQTKSRMFFFATNANVTGTGYGYIRFEINNRPGASFDDPAAVMEARIPLNGLDASNPGEGEIVFMKAGVDYYIHYQAINATRELEQRIWFTRIQ